MPDPHPLLGPLAGLLGTWAGEGTGQLPGESPFTWRERLHLDHVGTPALSLRQRTTRPDGSPFHAEDGWLRVPPELQDDAVDQWQVELAVTSPTGILEALAGTVRTTGPGGLELDVASTGLARTPAAGEVLATRRRWRRDGDALVVEFWMATPAHRDLFHHLTAHLHRTTD